MTSIVRVVIIDDSAFMRKSLSLMLESDPGIKVVGTARDGREGVEKIKELRPDICTMDVEMPGMDGLTALSIIMKEVPLPVLMVSSLTTEGAQATIDALARGAVDFIPKELSYVSLDIVRIREELIAKVKAIAQSRSLMFRLQRIRSAVKGTKGNDTRKAVTKKPPARPARRDFKAVVVGISTGGPMALLQTVPQLPANFPLGIAIVQHMPPHFTKSMADRLDSLSKVRVKEAEDGDEMRPGQVLVAPGGRHMKLERLSDRVVARISDEPRVGLYRPSADVMMKSAVEAYDRPLLGVIMTGMGRDGVEGLRLLKNKGGYVIAQDEETCVVYGMPKAAVDEEIADAILPLSDIPGMLASMVERGPS